MRCGCLFGLVDAEAAGAAAVVVDALAELFNLLCAHAGQAGEAAGFNGLGELVDAGDFGGVPEERDGFGAHAGELEEFQQAGAVFGEQFVAQGQGAGGGDGLQVGGHAFADAGNLEQAGGVGRGGHQVDGGLLGGFGGAAVAADAKAVAAVDLEQVGGLGQQAGHGGVVHGKSIRYWRSNTTRGSRGFEESVKPGWDDGLPEATRIVRCAVETCDEHAQAWT